MWRVLAGALGVMCAVAGWIAAMSGFIVLLLLFLAWGFLKVTWATAEEMTGWSDLWSSYGHPALWAVGTGIVVVRSGVLLVRGRRRLVLFLRRFGDSEATHAATVATRRVGRSWRLITLDDERITPVGVGGASRTIMGAAKAFESTRAPGMAVGRYLGKIFKFVIISAAWGAGGAAALTVVATEGDPDQRVAALLSLFDLMHPVGGTLGDLFRICAWVVVGCAVLFLAWTAVSLGLIVVSAPFLSLPSVLLGAVNEAEGTKNLLITNLAGIIKARATARRISRRVVSPRLMVLTVNSDVWQLAVGGMAAVSAIPLIDVSEPSENVLWEIEQMTRRFGPRCVFVGAYDRVVELTKPASAGTLLARQQELLQGHRVLAYTNDEQGVATFARALRATFELAVRLPIPVPRPPDPITKEMASNVMRRVR